RGARQSRAGTRGAAFAGGHALTAGLHLLESVGHRELLGREGFRAAARAGGADRRLDDALLAGERAPRLAARLSARCRDAARMVAAFPGTRRRGRQRRLTI